MPRAFNTVLSVESTQDFVRVQRALEDFGPVAAATFQSAAGQQLTSAWTDELAARAAYNRNQAQIVTADPSTTPQGFGLTVATGGSGPLGFLTRAYEFGTSHREVFFEYIRRGKSGVAHRVNRRTLRQIPTLSQTGWIAYPAAGRWSTRAFKMAMQILVKTAHDAIDGGK